MFFIRLFPIICFIWINKCYSLPFIMENYSHLIT